MPTHGFVNAKVKKWIFPFWFPGNWFKFGIIWNDFFNTKILDIKIQISFSGLKNHKNPGIQPIDDTGSFLCADDLFFTLIQEPENDTELVTVTENEFEKALNDTLAENNGFIVLNYAPRKLSRT